MRSTPYILLFLIGIFLISGCISQFIGPEWVVKGFYSDLDKGNFEKAADRTTIFKDKVPLDDVQKGAFITTAKLVFGEGGKNFNLGSVSLEEKKELDPKNFLHKYKGNVTKAYELKVKVPIKGEVKDGQFKAEILANIYIKHTVLMIDNEWYIASWDFQNFRAK